MWESSSKTSQNSDIQRQQRKIDTINPITARELAASRDDEDFSADDDFGDGEGTRINPTAGLRPGQRYILAPGPDGELPDDPEPPRIRPGVVRDVETLSRYFSSEEMTRRVAATSSRREIRFINEIAGITGQSAHLLFAIEGNAAGELEKCLRAALNETRTRLTRAVIGNPTLGYYYDIALVVNRLEEWRKALGALDPAQKVQQAVTRRVVESSTLVRRAVAALALANGIQDQRDTPIITELADVLKVLSATTMTYMQHSDDRIAAELTRWASQCIAVATAAPMCKDVAEDDALAIFDGGISYRLATELYDRVVTLVSPTHVNELGRLQREGGVYASVLKDVTQMGNNPGELDRTMARVVEKVPRFRDEFVRISAESGAALVKMRPKLLAGTDRAWDIVKEVAPQATRLTTKDKLMFSDDTMSQFAGLTAACMTRHKYTTMSPTPAATRNNNDDLARFRRVFADLRVDGYGNPVL